MSTYLIDGHTITDDDPQLQPLLASVYGKQRPRCLCRGTESAIELYIAHIGEKYVLKRMPRSATSHHPECGSFEPPPELSGLGEVLGSAIREHDDAPTNLALGFALSRSSGRNAPEAGDSAGDAATVQADANKLTLRGLLHYLWDEAGLTRWSPADDYRPWRDVHTALLRAAGDKVTKRNPLADSLYVPEAFTLDDKHRITARRTAKLRRIAGSQTGKHKLMVVVAEIKEIAPARFGHQLVFKQIPDCPFLVPDDLHKRLLKAFTTEIALWEARDTSHLIAIATFGVSGAGIPSIEEIAVMVTTPNWIPIESVYDKTLVDAFIAAHRPFRKTLRYNMRRKKPLASVVALDTDPATACYIVDDTDPAHDRERADLVEASALSAWTWKAGEDEPLPPLPDAAPPETRAEAEPPTPPPAP